MDEFTLPESLTALSLTDINALEAQAVQAFDAINSISPDDLTDANIAEMERLAGAIQSIRTERESRASAAQARRDRAAAAAATVTAGRVEPEPEPEPEEEDEDEQEPVVASATAATHSALVPSVSAVAKTPVRRPAPTGVALLAAADVPGYATGSRLADMRAVAKAFSNRANAFPRSPVAGTYIRSGVASIQRDFSDGLVDTNRDFDDMGLIDEAAREARLPGGSLVAAGGWCAPSETLYDLCVTESMDGLVDIPEIGITRGGIRFTKGPSFDEIYANAGFCQTEAQAIAGTAKPCVDITCPTFEEIRLDVCGICVRAPILTNAGYPELVQRWIEGTFVAQAHKESAQVIAKMVAAAGTAQALEVGAGVGFDLLTALEWVATSQKYKYRMALNSTLEVVLPYWAKAVVRGDLALRDNTEIGAITDQVIDASFAQRGVRVQWVYDWQPLVTNTDALACVAAQPATVDVLVYPAGTFVKGVADVISLDAVYDAASLAQNMYTAVFAESGYLVANRCYDACLISIPTAMCGSTGGSIDACLTVGLDTTP